jgi:hypothetical protein
MNKLLGEDDPIITTDDDEETIVTIDPLDASYPSDEEFDPYESGLNDFTFEDSSDANEII